MLWFERVLFRTNIYMLERIRIKFDTLEFALSSFIEF